MSRTESSLIISTKRFSKQSWKTLIPFLVLCILAGFRYWSISHGRTFHFDEWAWVLRRNEWSVSSLFDAHNGHLSVLPATLYLLLFHTVGLGKYGVYLCLAYAAHFAVSGALCTYFGKRFGRVAGLAIGAAFLFFGGGSQNILWSFQVGFMLSVLGYLIGRSSLEDPVVRDRTLFFALVLSLASSGVGIPVFIALLTEALIRRRSPSRLWPFLAAGLNYLLWYFIKGTSDANFEYLKLIPKYARDSASATVAASFDFTLDWGMVALGLLMGAFLVTSVKSRKISPGTCGALAFLATFWALTCLSRAQFWDIGAGRYVYAAIVPLLIIVGEVVPRRSSVVKKYSFVLLGALSIWATWSRMDDEGRWYKEWGQSVAAELRALEIYRANARFDYFPDKVRAPDVFAEAFFRTTRELNSSPAASLKEITGFSNSARIEFDRVSLELRAISFSLHNNPLASCSGKFTSPQVPRIRLHSGTNGFIALDGDVVIAFRRFADRRLDVMQEVVPRGAEVEIEVPSDGISRPWFVVQVAGNGQLCESN